MRMLIYGFLVNRVPGIRRKYHNMRYLNGTSFFLRLVAWIYLVFLNVAWLFGARDFDSDLMYPDKKKKLTFNESESISSGRIPPAEFAEKLLKYDVIAFDIFDTLIFRPFDCPTALFYLLGEKLAYPDFARIRVEMEWKARQQAVKEGRGVEISLCDIWRMIEVECGIDAESGMELEIGLEKQYCFANPYMLEVFRHLSGKKAKVIAVSDMYLAQGVIQDIVSGCGFDGISEYFISSEYGFSKGDGKLYRLISERPGDKRYIQIGDNMATDVKMAQKCGWDSFHYFNVNAGGLRRRAEDMSVLSGSLYRGIVNYHLLSGFSCYSKEYEFGFIYGGLFSVGYCQFIQEYVSLNRIEKILFLARDGDILLKVYDLLFPKEVFPVEREYVYWSRLAAVKIGAAYYKYDYFRRFLYHKVNQNYSLEAVFAAMGILAMLEDCLAYLGEQPADIILTDKNVRKVKDFLVDNWEGVLSYYEGELAAGRLYYSRVLGGVKKAVAVDVGWAGSGALGLDLAVNKIWGLGCEVSGLLAGTNTIHNAEPNTSEAFLSGGKLKSYLFSQEHNRDLWKAHDAAKGDNLVVEMLLSSPTGGFVGFSDDGFILKEISESDRKKAGECQRGILDFTRLYLKHGFNNKRISGRDAYAPIALLLKNKNYINSIISGEFTETGVN